MVGADLVFIDEYSIDSSRGKTYRWAPIGEEAAIISEFRKRSWSVIVAVNRSRVILVKAKQSTNKSDDFCLFLEKLKLVLDEQPAQSSVGHVLFLDNARIHVTQKVKATIKELKLKALTNCPYAPMLNAAERFICWHKNLIKNDNSNLK